MALGAVHNVEQVGMVVLAGSLCAFVLVVAFVFLHTLVSLFGFLDFLYKFSDASSSTTSLLDTFHKRHTYTVPASASYILPSVAQARVEKYLEEQEVREEQAALVPYSQSRL